MSIFSENPIKPDDFPRENRWGLSLEDIFFFGIDYMLTEDEEISGRLKEYFDLLVSELKVDESDIASFAEFFTGCLAGIYDFLLTGETETYVDEGRNIMTHMTEEAVRKGKKAGLLNLTGKMSAALSCLRTRFNDRLKTIPYGGDGGSYSDYAEKILTLSGRLAEKLTEKGTKTAPQMNTAVLLGLNILLIARESAYLRLGD